MTTPHARFRLLPRGAWYEIDWGSIYLGRDSTLAVAIPEMRAMVVSKRHCLIKKDEDGSWFIEDLGSTNGTWLDGEQVTGRRPIRDGMEFLLGRNGPRFEFVVPRPEPLSDATLLEADVPSDTDPERTALARPDGSDERPFRVGRMPEIELRHAGTGQRFAVRGYSLVIGRDPSVPVVVKSDGEKHVSGRHCEIEVVSALRVVVRDLGSRNGTWLNGAQVTRDMPLSEGDRIILGDKATTLVVERLGL